MDNEKCLFYIKEDKTGDDLRKNVFKNHFSEKVLGYKTIKDGYILISRKWEDYLLEGGVIDSEMCYLPETGYVDGGGRSYEFDASNVESAGKCVFLGTFHICYGHAITDSLKRLWFLNTEEGKQIISDLSVDLVYISSCNVDMPQWYLRILELAGLDVTRIKQVRNTTKYKEIIIPDNSLLVENDTLCFTKEYREVIEKIKGNVRETSYYKSTPSLDLYFTRTAFKDASEKETGEKAIERRFEKKGFKVVSPEKLTIEEQISLLMKCNKLVATESSCSHASVFCQPSAEVIILRKANYVNWYSTMIVDFAGHKTVYVDVHHSVMADTKSPRRGPLMFAMLGPFYLYVTKELARFMGVRAFVIPFFLRPSYLNYRFFNQKKKKYCRLKPFSALYNKLRSLKRRITKA